ncbi:MAG TPA: 30S ribosome-binding factor RbfA [Alphaproteobacteria bacterium]|nr:30S ribosome-binding factor RbfA [Alphaproteobacteria bacterium]
MMREAPEKRSRGGPSQRQLRVGEALRHALAERLARADLRDPTLRETSITVTEVRVSPDLRSATAYVTRLGGGAMEAVIEALNRAAPYLKSELARRVPLKFTPELEFVADPSFDRAQHIAELIKRGEGRS